MYALAHLNLLIASFNCLSSELSVGLFSSTQPDLSGWPNPTQPKTLPGEHMDPWPNPTHTQPNPHDTSNNNWPAVRK